MSILEYSKLILEKVSFDEVLFRKELLKAIHQLLFDEVIDLKNWCVEKFGYFYCEHAVPEFSFIG